MSSAQPRHRLTNQFTGSWASRNLSPRSRATAPPRRPRCGSRLNGGRPSLPAKNNLDAVAMRKSPVIYRSAVSIVLLGLLIVLAGAATAQEDPFGAAPKPGADAAAPAAKRVVVPDATKRDPLAIELLRASNPTTLQELLQAAQSALQYGRPDESKQYLARLLADKPAEEALAALTARYSDFLLELGRTKEMQNEGKQAADLIFAAATRTVQNPERIAAATAQLSDTQLGTRPEALGKLAEAGTQVVNPMLRALADASREKEHANIRAALVQIGRTSELPLIGALETPNQDLKSQIIAILGRMGSTRAAVHLVRSAVDRKTPAELRQISTAALQRISSTVPDEYEAEKYLAREISRLMRGDLPYETDADDRVRLWSWDMAKQEVFHTILPRRDAGVLLAARAATDLYALKPGDAVAQRLMLLTNLEWAKVLAGLDQPLPIGPGTAGAAAIQAGPRTMNQVLADALRQGRVAAAIAAAEVLGQCGDLSVLHSH